MAVLAATAGCRQDQSGGDRIVGNYDPTAVKIEITKSGLYQVTLAELQKAGLDIDQFESSQLQLSQLGTQIPYTLQKDAFIFYGEAPKSRYTAVRPYILRAGEPGRLMDEFTQPEESPGPLSQIPQTIHLEEDMIYLAETYRPEKPDVWYWGELGLSQKIDLSLNLPSVANSPALLRLNLWGTTQNPEVDEDHDFDLLVNGQLVSTIRWDGESEYTAEVPIPTGFLHEGDNNLLLDNRPAGASAIDIMQFNWLELEYLTPPTAENDRLEVYGVNGTIEINEFSDTPLAFEVSEPTAPRRLTGSGNRFNVTEQLHLIAVGPDGFLKPRSIKPLRESDWHNPENIADLIIVTTDKLAPALPPLVAAREAQGLAAVVVPLDEIYDEFGYGESSPDSLKTFFTYAQEKWSTPPRYILLVGDATTDYRNYLGKAPANTIPPFMIPVQFGGETVTDSRLVDKEGDGRPDIAIGRWPVQNPAEVTDLINRTLAYEQGSADARALFSADGTEPMFADIANSLKENSNLDQADTTVLNGPTAVEVAERLNDGVWLAAYVGHGSVERLGKDDVFSTDEINLLNIEQPPIVVQLTCLSGLFAHQELTSLSEQMLVYEKGPVLIIGATSLTLPFNQEPFALNLFKNLQNPEFERMGDAFTKAKQALPVNMSQGLQEISDTFVLFGDPSALIVRPSS